MSRPQTSLLLVLALISALAAPAAADTWPDGEMRDMGINATQWQQVRLLPGEPDTFYLAARSSFSAIWWGQKPATSAGVLGASAFMNTNLYAPDRAGNRLFLQYNSSTTLALRAVAFGGTVSPATLISGGVTNYNMSMIFSGTSRAEGGAWFMWLGNGVRLLRAAPGGTIAPGWPASGWRMAASGDLGFKPLAMASDGEGGVLALLVPDVLRVFRVSPDTTFAPGWPAAGLALETAPAVNLFNPESRLFRSGASHFIAVWTTFDPANTANTLIKCQRFSLAGALDPAWPAAGRLIANLPGNSFMDTNEFFKAVSDGNGGVTVAWMAGGHVWASHVLSDGAFAPGYAGGPLSLADLSGPAFGLGAGLSDGACVAFAGPDGSLRARWFDGNGDPWPSVAQHERIVFTPEQLAAGWAQFVGGTQHRMDALSDGLGGVYIAWASLFPPPYTGGRNITMTHAWWPGAPVGVTPTPPPPSLALSAGPNPARGALTARFSLPDARPARLELLDLAGRRVAAREVSGAGEHAERFDEAAGLPPGIYLLRLGQAGVVRTARVVVVR